MNLARYITAFSVFSVVAGVALPADAITLGDGSNDSGFTDISGSVSDISEGSNENDTQIFFFEEQTNFELNNDLTVDASSADIGTTGLNAGNGTQSTISSGEIVNSYYFQFDPVDEPDVTSTGSNTSNGESSDFTVTFDNEQIVGLIYEGNDSGESNALGESNDTVGLGSSGVTYPDDDPNNNLYGLEDFNDEINFVDENTVEFQELAAANNNTDDVRIVTQSQPVPSEAEGTMGLVALGGFFGYRYYKKRKQALSQ
jgi:hypothetical protein